LAKVLQPPQSQLSNSELTATALQIAKVLWSCLRACFCACFCLRAPAVHIMLVACNPQGLLFVHDNGYMHGDVKSQNVVVTKKVRAHAFLCVRACAREYLFVCGDVSC
jgi:serine/threonine protein kinase